MSTDHRPGRLIDLDIVSDSETMIAFMVDHLFVGAGQSYGRGELRPCPYGQCSRLTVTLGKFGESVTVSIMLLTVSLYAYCDAVQRHTVTLYAYCVTVAGVHSM